MISLENNRFLPPLQKLPQNVGDLGKLIVAKGFKKLPKVKKIAQSSHTVPHPQSSQEQKVPFIELNPLGGCGFKLKRASLWFPL